MKKTLKAIAIVLSIGAVIGVYCYFGMRADRIWYESTRSGIDEKWIVIDSSVHALLSASKPWSITGKNVQRLYGIHKSERTRLSFETYFCMIGRWDRTEEPTVDYCIVNTSDSRIARFDDPELAIKVYNDGNCDWEVPQNHEMKAITYLKNEMKWYYTLTMLGGEVDVTPLITSGRYEILFPPQAKEDGGLVVMFKDTNPRVPTPSEIKKHSPQIIDWLSRKYSGYTFSSKLMEVSYLQTMLATGEPWDFYEAKASGSKGAKDSLFTAEFRFPSNEVDGDSLEIND